MSEEEAYVVSIDIAHLTMKPTKQEGLFLSELSVPDNAQVMGAEIENNKSVYVHVMYRGIRRPNSLHKRFCIMCVKRRARTYQIRGKLKLIAAKDNGIFFLEIFDNE